jgi:hypothetical protein
MTSRSIRLAAFAAASALVVIWALHGRAWVGRRTDRGTDPPGEQVRRMIEQVGRHDPAAAAELARLRNRHDARALAAALTAAERGGSLAGVRRMADQGRDSGRAPYRVRLAEYAIDPRLFTRPKDRDAFLLAHGTTCQVLDGDGGGLTHYMGLLDRASADAETWRAVRDDSVALLLWDDLSDPTLRRFYLDERDWLVSPADPDG